MSKSSYSYVISEGVLCITDHDGLMSVTNNAENVLEEIKAELNVGKALDAPAIPEIVSMPDIIIYSDSNGDYDGMDYDGNDVVFYFLNTRNLTLAIELAKNRKQYDNI